jgi:hypothetical protein
MFCKSPKINRDYLFKYHYPIIVGNKNILLCATINPPCAYLNTSSRRHMWNEVAAPRLLNRIPDGD